MSTVNQQKIEERLKQIFVSPDVQKRVVDSIFRNKPEGWGRRSNSSYYKEQHGKEVKLVLDQMMKDKLDVVYQYEQYPHLNRSTLYQKIYQSIRYLIERLDDENHTYARFLEMVDIHRDRGIGIRISFIPELRDHEPGDFKPTSVLPQEETPKWKEAMDKWCEESEAGSTFERNKLMLSSEEIRDLKVSFLPLKNIMVSITANSIKLVKTAYEE